MIEGLLRKLFSSIIPKYVPKAQGTFMVDAQLNASGKAPAAIQCAVHYVRTGDGVRYCVLPPDAELTLPKNKSLTTIASDENQDWAPARHEETPLPEGGAGTKVHLPVHVGPWPCTPYTEETRAEAARAGEMTEHQEPEEWAPAYREQMRDLYRSYMKRKAMGSMVGRSVAPKTVLVPSDPTQLDKILESGRFRVSGQTAFRPLQPFDPNPKMPGPEERFVAIEEIQYSYL